MTNKRAPGWYLDEQSPNRQRWFDGDEWTEHTRASIPTAGDVEGWWGRRSKGTQIAVVGVAALLSLAVLGALLGEDPPETEVASDMVRNTASTEPSPQPPTTEDEREPVSDETELVEPAREPAEPQPAEPEPAEPEPAEPEPSGYERLVLSRDAGVNVRGINDVERSLANQLVERLQGEAWWPLVGEVYVDEDLFISDVRVGLDVLYHGDTTDLAVELCDAFLGALPETDSALQILVQPASVTGGGKEIDGSVTPWSISYFDTLARGFNDDSSCSADSVRQSTADRSEAYLADQA